MRKEERWNVSRINEEKKIKLIYKRERSLQKLQLAVNEPYFWFCSARSLQRKQKYLMGWPPHLQPESSQCILLLLFSLLEEKKAELRQKTCNRSGIIWWNKQDAITRTNKNIKENRDNRRNTRHEETDASPDGRKKFGTELKLYTKHKSAVRTHRDYPWEHCRLGLWPTDFWDPGLKSGIQLLIWCLIKKNLFRFLPSWKKIMVYFWR